MDCGAVARQDKSDKVFILLCDELTLVRGLLEIRDGTWSKEMDRAQLWEEMRRRFKPPLVKDINAQRTASQILTRIGVDRLEQ